MSSVKIELSLCNHYKNKPYKVLDRAIHSETQEELILYKTMYKNNLSSLWVRPKENFNEVIQVNGKPVRRFTPATVRLETKDYVKGSDIDAICKFSERIFKGIDKNELSLRLQNAPMALLITAFRGEQIIGYKLGYQKSNETFYSWLGAVDKDYRGYGLGQSLIEHQHSWCKMKGYSTVETKTLNQWTAMLHLNLKMGFLIVSTKSCEKHGIKIVMRKEL